MAFNTIKLKKYLDVIIERAAQSTIKPGMVLELTQYNTVQPHSDLGGEVAPPMFALEDELQGGGIATDYAGTNKVQVWVAQRGECVYALLADGQDVDIGTPLKSNGDGMLTIYTKDDSDATGHQSSIVAIALEAVDTSGSLSAGERIQVMVV